MKSGTNEAINKFVHAEPQMRPPSVVTTFLPLSPLPSTVTVEKARFAHSENKAGYTA